MTERIQISGKDIWVTVEAHTQHPSAGEPQEYFTATYYLSEPSGDPGGVLLIDEEQAPLRFESPVEALEYTSEKLSGMMVAQ